MNEPSHYYVMGDPVLIEGFYSPADYVITGTIAVLGEPIADGRILAELDIDGSHPIPVLAPDGRRIGGLLEVWVGDGLVRARGVVDEPRSETMGYVTLTHLGGPAERITARLIAFTLADEAAWPQVKVAVTANVEETS